MIVVLGCPAASRAGGVVGLAGLAGWIAASAAAAGAPTQLVGRIGDDDLGDAVLLALSRAGVGHAALLRDAVHATPEMTPDDEWADPAALLDPAANRRGSTAAAPTQVPSLDAGDVALGLRYLTEFAVLVIADPLPPVAAAAAREAAAFAGAHTIAIARGRREALAADDVFDAPDGDAESFATLIGTYAAGLDRGDDPAAAFAAAVRSAGWTPAAE